jgi:hypothetical protein
VCVCACVRACVRVCFSVNAPMLCPACANETNNPPPSPCTFSPGSVQNATGAVRVDGEPFALYISDPLGGPPALWESVGGLVVGARHEEYCALGVANCSVLPAAAALTATFPYTSGLSIHLAHLKVAAHARVCVCVGVCVCLWV